MMRCRGTVMTLGLASWLGMFGFGQVEAGIGPENVIVVVNADSDDSRTIANHYIQLRDIPSINVILLSDVPDGLSVGLEDFREKILKPILTTLDKRRLAAQARVIAYSSGFPTAVEVSEHTERLTNPVLKKYQRPVASLTGLTFFYQFVLGDNHQYLELGSNLYARGPFERTFGNPFMDRERRERFDQAQQYWEAGEFEEAAKRFEELAGLMPSAPSLAIRASESRAAQGDLEAAMLLVVQAVRSGWRSRKGLEDRDGLKEVLKKPQMVKLLSQLSDSPTNMQHPIGFSGANGWTVTGDPVAKKERAISYLLSCVLSVVHPNGSNVEQTVAVLDRAAKSDRTHPKASFWFTQTSDVRSKTRLIAVLDALQWLKHLKQDAQLTKGAVPNQPGRCVGLMTGAAKLNFSARPWTFVPGAIGDNLTSYGAKFDTTSQTKATDFLHHGAAMSSGPVHEPFSLQPKFPLPIMYGYYASGVTAIEAFYLSIASPYQTLIIGDPLAQPFAKPPSDVVRFSPVEVDRETTSVRVSRQPLAGVQNSTPTGAIEVFLEGKLLRVTRPTNEFNLNLPKGVSGSVRVRLALVGNDATQPRIAHSAWVDVGQSPKPVASGSGTKVQLDCESADSIELRHVGRLVDTVEGTSGTIDIDRAQWGHGPLRVRPYAIVEKKRIPGREFVLDE